MEQLIRVLERTVSSSQSDQNEAIEFIQNFIQRDFSGFLVALSDILYEQRNQPVVRAAAGLQLKNQLSARDEATRHQQQERWRNLSEETREHIKKRVLGALDTEVFRPSSAPQCVAYIALIELPNMWSGLIQALTSNVQNQNSTPQLRLASLEAIGYICQDIGPYNRHQSTEVDSDSITSAIVSGLKDSNNEIRSAATTALLKFSEGALLKISKTWQSISFSKLGELLGVEPQYAEKIVAQMIREERLKGHLDQIEGVIYFESKDVLQLFDDEILKFCSEINDIIEKVRSVVPEEWWATNASQSA